MYACVWVFMCIIILRLGNGVRAEDPPFKPLCVVQGVSHRTWGGRCRCHRSAVRRLLCHRFVQPAAIHYAAESGSRIAHPSRFRYPSC
uniref:Putative secreted protein n=1 Tax=Anopheles triannulatus TaxID=58253 RepID=A0A2M4B419_9DIPT